MLEEPVDWPPSFDPRAAGQEGIAEEKKGAAHCRLPRRFWRICALSV
jgi:hypothetical protein